MQLLERVPPEQLERIINVWGRIEALMFLHRPTALVADVLGVDLSIARTLIAILITMALSFSFMFVSRPSSRKSLSGGLGVFLLVYAYGVRSLYCVALACLCYALLLLGIDKSQLPRAFRPFRVVRLRYVTAFTWLLAFGFLNYVQLNKYLSWSVAGWTLDYSGPLMVFVQKITMLAHNIEDGKKMKSDPTSLTPRQRRYAISSMPKLSEYVAYVFFFPSVMFGPNFEFADFRTFLMTKKLPSDKPRENRMRAIGKNFAIALCLIPVAALSFNHFNASTLSDPAFLTSSLVWKAVAIKVVCVMFRVKYYFAWIMSDAFCAAAGFGLHEVDGRYVYGKYSNIDIVHFETTPDVRTVTGAWNRGTNRWLKYYIYDRVPAPRAVRTLMTYLMSALWHGFFPGYYVFFLAMALGTFTHRALRKAFRPLVAARSRYVMWIYVITGCVITNVYVEFVESAFALMRLAPILDLWAAVYYIPVIGAVALLLVATLVSRSRKTRAEVEKKDE
ncbi:Membrane bound O-acyl transferase, MBOAT [Carpediemonas membranifera]|uniref:Membrane bound O-acyl transferase, MBOAT n=1 Tax=Carpediemonas membranifera TaxID=201153 RepID=A0A8J6BBK5_9EUKA|nr:Membrane bound O-acyl transferase, MBOAT [Carpediemonas membranifera]|eukprot:KAG9393957.1 Membrane bound O-acyl transferase, MBOAT [Carpediemonas membranifera]